MRIFFVSFIGVILFAANANAQTLELLKDISPGFGNSNPANFTVANGKLFFTAMDDAFQVGLYVSGGTTATTTLIGPASAQNGSIQNLVAYNNKLFFSCNDGTNGQELWTSDGTVAGTVLFKDLYPGNNGSFPQYFTIANGKLFFQGDNANGERRLFVSDGTAAGTTVVFDSYIDIFNGNRQFAVLNNDVYFRSFDSDGYGLWKNNGTAGGTSRVKGHFAPGTLGCNFAVLNNKLYFSGDDYIHGSELCVTDGTDAGTHIVKNLMPDAGSVFGNGSPTSIIVFNSKLFFGAADETHGYEFFTSDGTDAGTLLVKDILPGTDGSAPQYLQVFNGKIYLACWQTNELWKSDGTGAGTQLVKTILPASRFGAVWNNRMYLVANGNPALWQSDGTTAGTGPATASNTTDEITIFATDFGLTEYNSALYFGGRSFAISPGYEPLKFVAATPHNFSFTGSGNWSNPANWAGGMVPPSTLTSGDVVVINGACILDIAVTAQPGSAITVATGHSLVIMGSLNII